MTQKTPRWEWRSFGKDLAPRLDPSPRPPARRLRSRETYLVTATSVDNAKIRDGMIDIKTLEQTSDTGLELWHPLLKAAFPLSAEQIAAVCRVVNRTSPPTTGESDCATFLRMMQSEPGLWVVSVDKQRMKLEVEGCLVEITDLRLDGAAFRTVAVEDSDPEKVLSTVARLGLQGRENINYVKAIQRLKQGTLAGAS